MKLHGTRALIDVITLEQARDRLRAVVALLEEDGLVSWDEIYNAVDRAVLPEGVEL